MTGNASTSTSSSSVGTAGSGLRDLIATTTELSRVGFQHEELPRVVVVGGTGAGKSSVVESLLGLSFLPIGDGGCTGRPLEIRLFNKENSPTYAEFDSVEGRTKIEDFAQIRSVLKRLTNNLAVTPVTSPIKLTIFGPECPTLTVIDLPGITGVVTMDLARSYCKDPRTIILAVIAADETAGAFRMSDWISWALLSGLVWLGFGKELGVWFSLVGLLFALICWLGESIGLWMPHAVRIYTECDSTGRRTIGVLTKLDKVDQGFDIAKTFGRQYGGPEIEFIAVKNSAEKSIKEALADEVLFFLKLSEFKCPWGANALAKKINSVVVESTREMLRIRRELLENYLGARSESEEQHSSKVLDEVVKSAKKNSDSALLAALEKLVKAHGPALVGCVLTYYLQGRVRPETMKVCVSAISMAVCHMIKLFSKHQEEIYRYFTDKMEEDTRRWFETVLPRLYAAASAWLAALWKQCEEVYRFWGWLITKAHVF